MRSEGALPPFRALTIFVTATAVLGPLSLILYQSLLNAPFFDARKALGFEAYAFVFHDPDFWSAFKNSIIIATGMTLIAVPLGGILAFVMERTDLPGKRWLEPLILVPSFVSPMVLSLGFVVAAGPVGFYSVWCQELFGAAPWGLYSVMGMTVIAGLTHVPNVYIYASSALKNLGTVVPKDYTLVLSRVMFISKAAKNPNAGKVWTDYILSQRGQKLIGSDVELFAMRDDVDAEYTAAKLKKELGDKVKPIPVARKYATIKGKAGRMRELPLGKWTWVAFAILVGFLFVTVIVPLSGIALRAFVTNWGFGVNLVEAFTLDNFKSVFEEPTHKRAIFNTILIGTVGGFLTVAYYTAIGFATHRRNDGWSRFIDYLVLVPRAIPGLLAGLAFLWLFLFIPPLTPIRSTIFSVWIAYTVVWLAYGMRLISSSLMQVSPELEEAARSVGASRGQISRDITLPLIRPGLIGSWLLVFMIFEREYSTAVYLLAPGTEVIGAQLVSLWQGGAIDIVAALSLINILLVGVGLAIALRFGVKLRD